MTTGAGFGLKVPVADRNAMFQRAWSTVVLELPDGVEAEVNVAKTSFWHGCRELIHRDIGRWLVAEGLAPWPRSRPPVVEVEVVGPRRFRVAG